MANHTEAEAKATLLEDFSRSNRENITENHTTRSLQEDRQIYNAQDLKEWLRIDTLNRETNCAERTKKLKQSLHKKCHCTKKCLVSNVTRKFPFISQLRGYKPKKFLLSDVVAGITIGIMHIPQGMGFAMLAGLPPVYGLYTSFFPVMAYFFFTSSRSTSFGSQSLVCLMLGPLLERECRLAGLCSVSAEPSEMRDTTVSSLGQTLGQATETSQVPAVFVTSAFDQASWNDTTASLDTTISPEASAAVEFKIGLAVLLACLVGLFQVILSVFQLGFISIYFSETFISACNLGGAFQIIATQIKFLVGLELPPVEGSFKLIKSWVAVFKHIKYINVADLIMSVISLTILIAVKKLINEHPRIKPRLKIPIPIEIIVVILATIITKFAELDTKFNVSVVGLIPQGIPTPSLPPLYNFKGQYLVDSFPIALIGFLSSVLMAKLFASKYDYYVDINQELFANGIANLFSSFFSCFPSSVAPPRTMLFDSVGGKSQLAFVFSSILIVLVLLVIGPLFQTLPTAVLASVIVVALLPLIERLVDGKYFWRVNKYDFLVWIGTVTSVIVLDLGIGIVIGVLLSILSLVLHTQRPKFHTAESLKGSNIYVNAEVLHSLKTSSHTAVSLTEMPSNITVFKYECPLYYANADIFSEKIMGLLNIMTCLESTPNEMELLENPNSMKEKSASYADVLKSIDRAIAAIHATAGKTSGEYTEDQRTNLKKLQRHRDSYVREHKLSSTSGSVTATRPVPPIPNTLPASSQHGEEKPMAGTNDISRHSPLSDKEVMSKQCPSESPVQPPKLKTHCASSKPDNNCAEHPKRASPNLSVRTNAPANLATAQHAIPSSPIKTISPANVFASPSTSKSPAVGRSHVDGIKVPKELGAELVERIRTSTALSYHDSAGAVETVLSCLAQRVPGLERIMEKVLETLKTDQIDADLNSDDAKRLQHIFAELATCKDDSQQRSWFLHEDEHSIIELLEELLFILNGANSDLCRAILLSNDCSAIHNLVVYYQMETRSGLRLLLLQVFGSLCGLSSRIISELLNSVLPSELARDILSDTQDMQKFYFSALVLAMVFSMGEPLSLQYYAQLNQEFVSGLLEMVENPPDTDEEMKVSDLLINVVLAFNLHFELPSENIVMKVFAERKTAKVFTEKILLFVNRGADPVRLFDHEPKPANSVLKFFADLYSSPATSNLLYTNDIKVLIDIILRQITDLTPGDTARTEHLSILELLLKNHNYIEHSHGRHELEVCLKRISQEEDPECDFDKRIISQIWIDNPNLFNRDCD